jgi:hypothetical protein
MQWLQLLLFMEWLQLSRLMLPQSIRHQQLIPLLPLPLQSTEWLLLLPSLLPPEWLLLLPSLLPPEWLLLLPSLLPP